VICGLILAGGRSTRFGREKAMAELGGRPLLAWVADVLDPRAASLAVSAGAGSAAADYAGGRGWAVLEDLASDPPGPLAGIAAGLRWAAGLGAEALCTVPCDTPFLPGDLVERLVSVGKGAAVIARTEEGVEPLCALWPLQALDIVRTWRGRPAPRDLLDAMKAVEVAFPDPAAFANLNTPQDYAAAKATARRVR
jgi:molybdopterin-guanine dinucleotide biosynthesis protein A